MHEAHIKHVCDNSMLSHNSFGMSIICEKAGFIIFFII